MRARNRTKNEAAGLEALDSPSALCGIQIDVTKDRRYADDLPTISISRLRAEGVITAETSEFVVRLGDVEQIVGVAQLLFPNGGGWSFFLCPCCGKQARTLKLLNRALICRRCRIRRGVRYRSEPTGARQRAAMRIPKLIAMLDSDKPLRLNRSTMTSKMERRARHEASLERKSDGSEEARSRRARESVGQA